MSVNDFLNDLASVKEQFRWVVEHDGCIRGFDEWDDFYCPITAVVLAQTGETHNANTTSALYAAQQTSLDRQEADNIISAADLTSGHNRHLRRRLAKVLGLKLSQRTPVKP